MLAPLTTTFVKSLLISLSVGVLVGCSSNDLAETTGASTPGDADSNRLSAVDTAHPELQGFLDSWDKVGVTIAETPATDDSQLIAFVDDNGNAVPDVGEPVLAQAEGALSDIRQLVVSQQDSEPVTGQCGSNSFVVRPGNYGYRGKTIAVGFNGLAYGGGVGGQCTVTLSLSSTPFPDEEWAGIISGTKSGKPFAEFNILYWSNRAVQIDIPFPTSKEMFDDVYGKDGELAISSHPINDDYRLPEDRMIIGSWKSEVTFSN